MKKLLNVLIVEDNPGDAFLIEEQFRMVKTFKYRLIHAEYLERAIAILAQDVFDVILLDLSLPDSRGIETLKNLMPQALSIPIVILTGINDEELAIEAVRNGAQDYLVKGQVRGDILIKALRYAIERKQIQEKLQIRTLQLEALNRELEAFSYMVSHDLRNPITIIQGMADLLHKKYQLKQHDEEEFKYLQYIRNTSKRMERIVRDLLILSQVKQSNLEIKPVNLSSIAQNICSILQQQQSLSNIEVIIQPNIIAIGDENLLTHALENLLHNAWKYTAKQENSQIEVGTINPAPIKLAQSLELNHLEKIDDLQQRNRIRSAFRNSIYFIRDNGIGFDPTTAEKLFIPFHRLDNAKKFEGTGIGLAIVQSIIHRHHGRVWAEAAEGKGATFYFTLAI